jgi:hypothetical protein
MVAKVEDLANLPDWPRGLSVAHAAAYVGLSVPAFMAEVDQGKWPPPRRAGAQGGRLIWDKKALDDCYDRLTRLTAKTEITEEEALARIA